MKDVQPVTAPSYVQKQLEIIKRKTPKDAIMQRPGRGGKSFTYVAVGYVISTLNDAFGPAWDWEIIEQQVGKRQIWVKGKLTIWFSPEYKFTKMSFGGSEIKLNSQTNEPVDIADDLKAASADALKKAASMLGIASDVYFPQLDNIFEGESYP